MPLHDKIPVWKMVREAVEALGGKTTNVAVRDWILQKYPGTNPTTIACQIIVCTVNHDSRIHYADNQKPRSATTDHDFLFRPARGEIEWYEPERHRQWEIAQIEDGRSVVRECDAGAGIPDSDLEDHRSGFALEAHLRDYLARNLHIIEDGLELYADENGKDGVEYNTDMGRIDILATDKDGGLLVVELKVARGSDTACGQIMRYTGWVKRHVANGKSVRGLIIAQHISDRIRYAIADIPEITAREYNLSISLKDTPPVNP